MLPGRKYTSEEFLRIAWNRKWLIVLPALVAGASTFVVTSMMPNRYRSTTTVLVVPQRVPTSYVRSTVTAGVSERLQTIQQQILSRTRLEQIIEEFNLYPEERKTMIMEDIVTRMRVQDVKVETAKPRNPNEDASSFTVGFESGDPRLAMRVADRLASMFVQENLNDRTVMADATNQFLQAQLEDSRRRLNEHDKKLEEFKRRNAGRLPSQVYSNLQMMQTTQARIQANTDATNFDRTRLESIEALLAAPPSAPLEAPVPTQVDGRTAVSAAQLLANARTEYSSLRQRLTPAHPDVQRAQRQIEELTVKAEAEAKLTQATVAAAPTVRSDLTPQRVRALQTEAEEIRLRLQVRQQDSQRLEQQMSTYQAQFEAAPSLESEQTELMRDYSTLYEQYNALLRKSEESKIAVNLERRQIGEQFRVVDGARLPERPISPNRPRLNFIGLLAGLALGVGLVGFLEYRDTTLKTDDDVVMSLQLPVLAVIPRIVTTGEREREQRRRVLLALTGSVGTVALVAALMVVWRLDLVQAWVR